MAASASPWLENLTKAQPVDGERTREREGERMRGGGGHHLKYEEGREVRGTSRDYILFLLFGL